MTLHIRVPPDLETKLREQAAAAGKELEIFAREALEEKVASSNGPSEKGHRHPADQRVNEWLSWTASHPKLGYVVDDSRESIYAGRGE